MTFKLQFTASQPIAAYVTSRFLRHHLPSILGRQKGVNNKSKEYKASLIGRVHKLMNVEKSFNEVLNMSQQQSCIFFVVTIIP